VKPANKKFFKKNTFFFNFLLLVQKIDVILTQKQQRTAPRGAQKNFTMNKKQITAALLAIAATNPEGFTVSRSDLTALNDGYAVAIAETQNSFNGAGLARVIDYASKHENITAFGGWLDQETGFFYWDCVMIFKTRAAADRAARRNNQLAFFDLKNKKEIRIKS
jgi:hypothetical protein